MRAQALEDFLVDLFPTRRPILVEGPPGGGKTSVIKAAAKRLGVECRIVAMPLKLVEDFGTMFPNPDGVTMGYRMPDWFPIDGIAPDQGILFFDDRNQAPSDLQKVQANIMQERTLHGYKLPDGWQVLSSGNRASDRAGSNKVLTQLANRETVIEYETHIDDFTAYASANGVHPLVIGYLNYRPGALNDFEPNKRAFGSARSWKEGVSDIFHFVHPKHRMEAFAGAVGEGRAAEFIGFIEVVSKLPDPDKVLADPHSYPVPTQTIEQYALVTALATRVDVNRFQNFVTFLSRMSPEMDFMGGMLASRRDPALTSAPGYSQWCVRTATSIY